MLRRAGANALALFLPGVYHENTDFVKMCKNA